MSTVLVLGSTGTVGRELSTRLEAAGHHVRRATSRTAGAGQVHLDLVTGAGVGEAVRGVDAVFLLSPPGHTDQLALLAPVVDAARAAGVRKAVMMTAMGADADPSTPMRRAELHLEQSGMAWNVIRPNWFMQNFHTYWRHGIVTDGAIRLPTGDAAGSFIDARDIAAVAAALLTSPDHDGAAFDLTGAEALDHHDVARQLTAALARPIRYEEITPEAMRTQLLRAGLPPDYAEFMLVILHYFKLGAAARVTDAVSRITGEAPRRFAEYARDHRGAYAA